jgi:hypothetical protein
VSNEQVAELSDKNPRFIGFSSVDPRSKDAPRMLERAVVGLGLKGLKLNPALQGFFINDREHAFPVYQTCSELKIPLLIHCGMSWAPTAQARYAHPLMLEEVAQEFPNLRIIIAHFGWPWVSDAVMLAIKYPNIYLDTAILYSGTPADAYRKVLGEEVGLDVIERSLRDKILFGSNYPRVDIRRSVRGIQSLKINETLKKKIMSENALQILSKTEGENL